MIETKEYRGKTHNGLQGAWMYGDKINWVEEGFGSNLLLPAIGGMIVMEESVGRYTEFHDCNGREIFEEDIMRSPDLDYCPLLVKPSVCSDSGWGLYQYSRYVSPDRALYWRDCTAELLATCEVIGNLTDGYIF